MGVSELARRTGLAKTTVLRLTDELNEIGLLDRRGSSLELGSLLFELGHRVPRTRDLRQLATQYLRRLATESGATALLALPGGKDVLFLEKYFGQHGEDVAVTTVEGHVPYHCGASGKVLLAYSATEVRERVLAEPLARKTRWTITDHAQLRTELDRIRAQGFAVERRELVAQYCAVSAPVLVDDGAVAALTVVGAVHTLDPLRFAPLVCDAAGSLSRDFSAFRR